MTSALQRDQTGEISAEGVAALGEVFRGDLLVARGIAGAGLSPR